MKPKNQNEFGEKRVVWKGEKQRKVNDVVEGLGGVIEKKGGDKEEIKKLKESFEAQKEEKIIHTREEWFSFIQDVLNESGEDNKFDTKEIEEVKKRIKQEIQKQVKVEGVEKAGKEDLEASANFMEGEKINLGEGKPQTLDGILDGVGEEVGKYKLSIDKQAFKQVIASEVAQAIREEGFDASELRELKKLQGDLSYYEKKLTKTKDIKEKKKIEAKINEIENQKENTKAYKKIRESLNVADTISAGINKAMGSREFEKIIEKNIKARILKRVEAKFKPSLDKAIGELKPLRELVSDEATSQIDGVALLTKVGEKNGMELVKGKAIQPSLVFEYLPSGRNFVEDFKLAQLETSKQEIEDYFKEFNREFDLGMSFENFENFYKKLQKESPRKLIQLQNIIFRFKDLQTSFDEIRGNEEKEGNDGEMNKQILGSMEKILGIKLNDSGKLNFDEILDIDVDRVNEDMKRIQKVVNDVSELVTFTRKELKQDASKFDIGEFMEVIHNPLEFERKVIDKFKQETGLEEIDSIQDGIEKIRERKREMEALIEREKPQIKDFVNFANEKLLTFGGRLPSVDTIIDEIRNSGKLDLKEIMKGNLDEGFILGLITENLALKDANDYEALKQSFLEKFEDIDKQLDKLTETLIKEALPKSLKVGVEECKNIQIPPETLKTLKAQLLPLISDFLKKEDSKEFGEGIIQANGEINLSVVLKLRNHPILKKLMDKETRKKIIEGNESGMDEDEKKAKGVVDNLVEFVATSKDESAKTIRNETFAILPEKLQTELMKERGKEAMKEVFDTFKKEGLIAGFFAFLDKIGELFEPLSKLMDGIFKKFTPFKKIQNAIAKAKGEKLPYPDLEEKEKKEDKKTPENPDKLKKDALVKFGLERDDLPKLGKIKMEELMNNKVDLKEFKTPKEKIMELHQLIKKNSLYEEKDDKTKTVLEFLKLDKIQAKLNPQTESSEKQK